MNNKLKRLVAAGIDFYLDCFLSTVCVAILTLGKLDTTPFSVTAYLVLFFGILLTKDYFFKNASIGKLILKLKVVKTDKTKLRFIDVLKRNIPIILLPLEIFLILAEDRRLGDIWAKTAVVDKAKEE
mgnify:CR=1 FL=1